MTREFKRAVVTGGAGFLGSRVCRRLLAQGTAVVCLDSFISSGACPVAASPGAPPFEFRRQDVTDPFDVPGPVDLVMHLASPASPADHARYPLQTTSFLGSAGSGNALDLAARTGARFVLASSSEAYRDRQAGRQAESYRGNASPLGPRSAYDEAKRYAEALTAAYQRTGHADTAIARIFNSYGAGMRPGDGGMVPTFACQALRGEPVTVSGDGKQTRSLCHADDTVRGLLLLAASDLAGPVRHWEPGRGRGRRHRRQDHRPRRVPLPIRYVPLPPGDPMARKPDITLARVMLGFEPRIGWREGLTETVAWLRRVLGTGPDGLRRAA